MIGMYTEYVEFGTNWDFKHLQGILKRVPRDKGKLLQESGLKNNETLQSQGISLVHEELEIQKSSPFVMFQRSKGRLWSWERTRSWRAVPGASGQLGQARSPRYPTEPCSSPCTAKGCFPGSLLCVRSPCRPQGGHRCSLSLEHLLSLCTSRGSLLNLSQFPGVVLDMLGTEEGKEKLPRILQTLLRSSLINTEHRILAMSEENDSDSYSTAYRLRSELTETYYSTGYHTHIVVLGGEDTGGRTSAKWVAEEDDQKVWPEPGGPSDKSSFSAGMGRWAASAGAGLSTREQNFSNPQTNTIKTLCSKVKHFAFTAVKKKKSYQNSFQAL